MISKSVFWCSVWLALGSGSPIRAQTSPRDLVTVGLITVRTTDPSFVWADVELKNASNQTITAYTVSVKARYSDGRELSRSVTTDSVWVLTLDRLGLSAPPDSRFDPGTVSRESVSLPPDPKAGFAPIAEATVEMVALADKTIYGPPGAAEALRQRRQQEADLDGDIADTLALLQKASDPRGELTRVLAARSAALPSDHAGRRVGEARLKMLESALAPVLAMPNKLADAQKIYNARRAVMLDHSLLKQSDPINKEEVSK